MKRFFKTGAACALALALMSTSAFAAVEKDGNKVEFGADGKLDVTIAGNTTGEQVALMVLKGKYTTTDILASVKNTDIAYIDQKTGTSSLAFSDINVGTENVVTVFAGSTKTPKAILLGSASRKAPELNASAKSFNVAAGVETSVDLALTDEYTKPVTDATVTYRVKNSGNAFEKAGNRVSYVENVGWKFNFADAATYEVMFTKGTVSETVYVCAYINKPVENFGTNKFVMRQVPDSTKVVAAVRVNLEGRVTTGKEKEKIIWSIRTNEAAGDNQYYSSPIEVNLGSLSGALDLVCKFDNNTNSDVTEVNVIYKDAAGKVFFTDPADAGREYVGSEEQK